MIDCDVNVKGTDRVDMLMSGGAKPQIKLVTKLSVEYGSYRALGNLHTRRVKHYLLSEDRELA